MAVNPSIQLGTDGNWAIKEDNLLAYKKLGSRFFNREFDFSRGTTATFIGEDGLIQESAIDVPRIDFADDTTGHLLLEPQSTNLVAYSEDYNTGWNRQSGNISNGGSGLFYLSPTSNVIKYESTGQGFNQMYYQLPSPVTIGTTYTQQGYVKCDDAPYIHFQIAAISGNTFVVWDNINNVVVSAPASVDSYNITSLNGWIKAEITYTAAVASTYSSLKTYFSTSPTNNQAGIPIGTIAYQTFVQVEQQSYATSYIPTSGSTVTRNQEICNNSGTASDFNSEEGVLYAEIAALNSVASLSSYITISDGTYNNRASILFSSGGTNQIRTFLRVGGATQIDVTNSVTDVTSFNKVAFSYKENDFKVYINGTLVSTDTSGSVWSADTVTKLSFSEINTLAGLFQGKTKNIQVFNYALTDEELQTLTT